MKRLLWRSLRATVAVIAVAPAQAEPPAQADLAAVSVTATRDPQTFDVPRGVALMRRFESIPANQRDKIRLVFYLRSRNGEPLPAGLRVSLATGETEQPLELLPSGELNLPALDDAAAAASQIMTTARRGTLVINYVVEPRVVRSMTLGTLRSALAQARDGWKTLYGPLLGWSVPMFTCAYSVHASPTVVTLRDPQSSGEIAWQSDSLTQVRLPLSDRRLADPLIIDWGGTPPQRVGGCVSTGPVADR